MPYISSLLLREMKKWGRRKVFIAAPTGCGKTSFILRDFLPWTVNSDDLCGRKLLILCNRKLLEAQYRRELSEVFSSYEDMQKAVSVQTYQGLYDEIRKMKDIDGIFAEYEAIVCDEAHYFYSDSDFNPGGTYVCLNAIIAAGLARTIIFMSATMEEVKPLIEECLTAQAYRRRQTGLTYETEWGECISYDYMDMADFSRFDCFAADDLKTICECIVAEDVKSVIFVDSKKMADDISSTLKELGINGGDIGCISAENINDEQKREIVNHLVYNSALKTKILITTSVLDNGVNIKDDIGTMVVITDSRISFLQMLGRVRCIDPDKTVKLFMLSRPAHVFQKRRDRYMQTLQQYEKARTAGKNRGLAVVQELLENRTPSLIELYRQVYIACPEGAAYLQLPQKRVRTRNNYIVDILYGDIRFIVNAAGERKCGDAYMTEDLFYRLALSDPLMVIQQQMQWMKKAPDELKIISESPVVEAFRQEALEIKNCDKKEFAAAKAKLNEKYRKSLFPDISERNGGISNEKLEKILEKYELSLESTIKDRRVYYTVCKK